MNNLASFIFAVALLAVATTLMGTAAHIEPGPAGLRSRRGLDAKSTASTHAKLPEVRRALQSCPGASPCGTSCCPASFTCCSDTSLCVASGQSCPTSAPSLGIGSSPTPVHGVAASPAAWPTTAFDSAATANATSTSILGGLSSKNAIIVAAAAGVGMLLLLIVAAVCCESKTARNEAKAVARSRVVVGMRALISILSAVFGVVSAYQATASAGMSSFCSNIGIQSWNQDIFLLRFSDSMAYVGLLAVEGMFANTLCTPQSICIQTEFVLFWDGVHATNSTNDWLADEATTSVVLPSVDTGGVFYAPSADANCTVSCTCGSLAHTQQCTTALSILENRPTTICDADVSDALQLAAFEYFGFAIVYMSYVLFGVAGIKLIVTIATAVTNGCAGELKKIAVVVSYGGAIYIVIFNATLLSGIFLTLQQPMWCYISIAFATVDMAAPVLLIFKEARARSRVA